ncbi:hypothetical protein BpHYR1_021859 [Brachionus plicatilis]|uniref:Uncharacterized protein n=1 Tax=Brachionus plicatilis TaxID=10195 RepID=A0A3M7T4K8_BRAPC|nr:hypothetical protein BpHYR1_021859 [Brachionus plicatilis]
MGFYRAENVKKIDIRILLRKLTIYKNLKSFKLLIRTVNSKMLQVLDLFLIDGLIEIIAN